VGAQDGYPTLFPALRAPRLYIDAGVSYLFPLARFSDITPPAPGPSLEVRGPLGPESPFEVGVMAAYVGLEGRDPEVERGAIAPVLATMRYRLLRDRWFLLNAQAGAGIIYEELSYDENGMDVFDPTPEYEQSSQVVFGASLGLEYRATFGRLVHLATGFSYLLAFEGAGPLGSLLLPLTLGVGL
jgi:hypothetical protein